MNFGMCPPFGYGDRYGYNSGNACLGGYLAGQRFIDKTFNAPCTGLNVVSERTQCFRKTGEDWINNHVYAGNFWGIGDGNLYDAYNNWNGNLGGSPFSNYSAGGGWENAVGGWRSLGIG